MKNITQRATARTVITKEVALSWRHFVDTPLASCMQEMCVRVAILNSIIVAPPKGLAMPKSC